MLHKPPPVATSDTQSSSLIRIKEGRKMAKPEWHAPWKLKTVIAGHTGWVRCLTVDVSNEWFARYAFIRHFPYVTLLVVLETESLKFGTWRLELLNSP